MKQNNIENLLLKGVIFMKSKHRILIIQLMKNIPPVVIAAIIIAVSILLIQYFFKF